MRMGHISYALIAVCVVALVPSAHAGNGMSMGGGMDASMVNTVASVSILDMDMVEIDGDTNMWKFTLPIDRLIHDGEDLVLYPVLIAEDGTVYRDCNGVIPVINLSDDTVVGVCITVDVGAVPHTIGLVDEDNMLVCSADIRASFGNVLNVQVAVYNRDLGQLLFVFDDAVEMLDVEFITVYAQDGTEVSLDETASGMYTDNVAWYSLDTDADSLYVDVQSNGVLCDAVFLGMYSIPVIVI